MREDRTVIFTGEFISSILTPEYVAPVNDPVESIWMESSNKVPVLFLLSSGADPTQSIDDLARRKKKWPTDKVSMGEGQDVIAHEKMSAGFLAGNWVIL